MWHVALEFDVSTSLVIWVAFGSLFCACAARGGNGGFSLAVPSFFPLACLALVSTVAGGNGELFTLINSRVLSYEVTKQHFGARCQGVSLQFPWKEMTFQIHFSTSLGAYLKRAEAIIRTKQRKRIWSQNILIRRLKNQNLQIHNK